MAANAPMGESTKMNASPENGTTPGADDHGDDEVDEATDVVGKHTRLGPTDGYTYTESITSIRLEPVKMVALYGMIVATVDLYETVNASGKDGSCHTTELSEGSLSIAHPATLLRALVMSPDELGVASLVDDTEEPHLESCASGSGEATNHAGAAVGDGESEKKTKLVPLCGSAANGYVLSPLGKLSDKHTLVGTGDDYERLLVDEVKECTCKG